MKTLIFILSTFLFFSTAAQDKISSWEVNLNSDSILLGNRLEVTFTLKNAAGENFVPPSFADYKLLSGPNQASQMSIVNGEMTREMSFSFVLEPLEIGSFFIEPASIEVNGEIIETEPREFFVYPNPDGIIQKDPKEELFWNNLPWEAPQKLQGKKKKKIYKL